MALYRDWMNEAKTWRRNHPDEPLRAKRRVGG